MLHSLTISRFPTEVKQSFTHFEDPEQLDASSVHNQSSHPFDLKVCKRWFWKLSFLLAYTIWHASSNRWGWTFDTLFIQVATTLEGDSDSLHVLGPKVVSLAYQSRELRISLSLSRLLQCGTLGLEQKRVLVRSFKLSSPYYYTSHRFSKEWDDTSNNHEPWSTLISHPFLANLLHINIEECGMSKIY